MGKIILQAALILRAIVLQRSSEAAIFIFFPLLLCMLVCQFALYPLITCRLGMYIIVQFCLVVLHLIFGYTLNIHNFFWS